MNSMKYELNSKTSLGKQTRHFNIKYLHITDLINRKETSIDYCPTEEMIGNYMSNPTTGAKFHKF